MTDPRIALAATLGISDYQDYSYSELLNIQYLQNLSGQQGSVLLTYNLFYNYAYPSNLTNVNDDTSQAPIVQFNNKIQIISAKIYGEGTGAGQISSHKLGSNGVFIAGTTTNVTNGLSTLMTIPAATNIDHGSLYVSATVPNTYTLKKLSVLFRVIEIGV